MFRVIVLGILVVAAWRLNRDNCSRLHIMQRVATLADG